MGLFRGVELDDVELTGGRLVLRRWQPGDAEAVHAIVTRPTPDPAMYRYLALPDPYTLETASAFVTRIGHEGRGEGTGLGCAMVEREGGRLVGACALRLSDDGEIGYWVSRDARGHGYAAEAVRLLADWAFDLQLARVRLLCDVTNLASIRTALSAGFVFEGVGRNAVVAGSPGAPSERRGDLARFARLPWDPDAPIEPSFPWPVPGGLDDGVLSLRPATSDDVDALIASEDEVSVGYGFTGHAPSEREQRRRAAHTGLEWLVGRMARFAMVDLATGSTAGFLDVRRSGPPGVAGIGYTVVPSFRGRGYTARALRLVTPWAFEVAGLTRLEVGAKAPNTASQRAAVSGGFVPDGVRTARLRNPDGSYSDEVCFARVAGGDTGRWGAGGDTEMWSAGGDTEMWSAGGDKEMWSAGGDTDK